ncbi:MAG TPA: hypothetical protein PLF25_10835, partial [Accumulibacter sp.]|nr:hypothetical protein [Accumulibacter sp.]
PLARAPDHPGVTGAPLRHGTFGDSRQEAVAGNAAACRAFADNLAPFQCLTVKFRLFLPLNKAHNSFATTSSFVR